MKSIARRVFTNQRVLTNNIRKYATAATEAEAIRYSQFGNVASGILKKEKITLPSVGDKQVLVKMLAAPLNPADFNMIEGTYGIKTELPAIGGNEGVGVIESVGSGVTGLKVGDWVVPAKPRFGTWATHAVCNADDVDVIPKDIPVEYAATLSVNPCTALRLLDDFVTLKPGDVVIQNGANSLVGQSVIQLAKARGVKTINVVRNRPGNGELIERLKLVGGDIVVTEDYLRTPAMARLVADLPKPKLALNCVGGQSATDIARNLSEGGIMVTYGGMSRKPVTIPTSLFIFKDIQLRGFWLTHWLSTHGKQDRQAMYDKLVPMIKNKQLVLFFERHPFADFDGALQKALTPLRDRKVVVRMDDESQWGKL